MQRFTPTDWVVLPPGDRLLLRRPADEVFEGTERAELGDILRANYGAPFPWGWTPTPVAQDRLWNQYRLGNGGLYHDKWFVCADGRRIGGASNVLTTGSAALRYCLYLDGGSSAEGGLADNEGCALTRPADVETTQMYRKVMMYAAAHIMADRGNLILTPVQIENGKMIVYIAFGGRCRTCPSPLAITIRALQEAIPEYEFRALPEWVALWG